MLSRSVKENGTNNVTEIRELMIFSFDKKIDIFQLVILDPSKINNTNYEKQILIY